ncbi:MAG: VWA domain-containing protein [Planctomycetaceae bacterium]
MRLQMTRRLAAFRKQHRKGVFFALAIICLIGAMTFVGLSVDLGMITVTKTRMQAAADSAALAAAQEIVVAVREAAAAGETDLQIVQALSAAQARDMAEHVCDLNGFYIEPETDVVLGSRLLAEDGVSYVEAWGTPPYNMVKVRIRKDNPDSSAEDAKLPLIFAPVVGERAQAITAEASAFIESRDIVAVLDYSGSMAYDSLIYSGSINRLGLSAIELSLDDIWSALSTSGVAYSDDANTLKFPSTGFGGINTVADGYISSSNVTTVFETLNLDDGGPPAEVSPDEEFWLDWSYQNSNYSGNRYYTTAFGYDWRKYVTGSNTDGIWRRPDGTNNSYQNVPLSTYTDLASSTGTYIPFPQEGKSTSTGLRKGKPSASTSESLWRDYIQFVMNDSTLNSYGYRKKYCYRTLMHYLISERMENHNSEDLWRAPIYPHHALKEGMSLFTGFLDSLGYGDHVGLVTYATTSRVETGLWDDGADVTVDLGTEHLTDNYTGIDTIQTHKQPGHYNRSTGIGYGIDDAIDLIASQGRYGAQKAILLMTDGQSNQYPSGFDQNDLPSDWDWNEITDFDGDGVADFTIDSSYGGWDSNWRAALYAFMKAKEAKDAGITVNTISVGAGADTVLMQAIADMTGGEYLNVPGGSTIAEMEADLEAAFAVLAGNVPPARLMNGAE